MNATVHAAAPLHGTLTVPPDKAICHRAVLVAAVANGTTAIHPWPRAEDCQRTRELVERLGVSVHESPDGIRIDGLGPEGLQAPRDELDCGESGTTFRLSAGLLAGQPFASRLVAGPSLSRRPMRRIVEPLTQMGARFDGVEGSRSPTGSSEFYPPLTVHGTRPLRAVRYEVPVASAQVKSALLFAGLFADGTTTVVERWPTRDHTERILRAYGARIRCTASAISIEPGPLTTPGVLTLPGDLSSAAFFLVAASCVQGSRVRLEGVSLNPTRVGILHILQRMGARLTVTRTEEDWEPRGTIVVESASLRATSLEASEAPGLIDELPILMVAAACAEGTTRLSGIGELRVKETDRLQSMVGALRQLGARVSLPAPETVEVTGGRLTGATVESAGDHRTAMSLVVAGLAAQGTTTVSGVECVAKSFPEFFERLGRLCSSPTVKT